jgi:hypothetical protein
VQGDEKRENTTLSAVYKYVAKYGIVYQEVLCQHDKQVETASTATNCHALYKGRLLPLFSQREKGEKMQCIREGCVCS